MKCKEWDKKNKIKTINDKIKHQNENGKSKKKKSPKKEKKKSFCKNRYLTEASFSTNLI